MIRLGIIMGGPSREREIAFAGGRTVYDNLDRKLFEPVPLLVDSRGKLVLLDWPWLYRGSIRDFFPPPAAYPAHSPFQYTDEQLPPPSPADAWLRQLGQPLAWEELPRHIDAAFLTLHGEWGEDGRIQGLLEWLGLPYTGSGILGSALGADKRHTRRMMQGLGYACPPHLLLRLDDWLQQPHQVLERIAQQLGLPCVAKHPSQGSSIGVAVARTAAELAQALDTAFFLGRWQPDEWRALGEVQQLERIQRAADPRAGHGLPAQVLGTGHTIAGPDELQRLLAESKAPLVLRALDSPDEILLEAYLEGTEFSVIVIEDREGNNMALPPTEIVKPAEVFDYRAKYLPGQARKRTPAHFAPEVLQRIATQACQLKADLGIEVYARLDGILTPDQQLYFNDPNTTSGMLPSSFFFHQAAEWGINPKALLSWIVLRSLETPRGSRLSARAAALAQTMAQQLAGSAHQAQDKLPVAVVLGGYSFERHISVESGRNIYEKLSASAQCQPQPLFLLNNALLDEATRASMPGIDEQPFSLWHIPIRLLLKDNADDIAAAIVHSARQVAGTVPKSDPAVDSSTEARTTPAIEQLRALLGMPSPQAPQWLSWAELKVKFAFVFIALHGRPGEDGQLQAQLDRLGLPYNGSGPQAAALSIDKFASNEQLMRAGLAAPAHRLLQREHWLAAPDALEIELETELSYPLILKPVDDGCSSAVKYIPHRQRLRAYLQASLGGRNTDPELRQQLGLLPTEEFPARDTVLAETCIGPRPGWRCTELTVGFVNRQDARGETQYQVFLPSETVAVGGVLSLEEKFLAGEGQNITPARLLPNSDDNMLLLNHVRAAVEKALRTLGVQGYGRFDLFVRYASAQEYEVVFIEINNLPGMTPATCIFHQAALDGYRPLDFILQIMRFGYQRKGMSLPKQLG